MGKKKTKLPKLPKNHIIKDKNPRIGVDINSFENSKPSWRFSKLVVDQLWGWDKCINWRDILNKIKNFETMTWHEILIKSKKQNHSVSINELTPKAKKEIEKNNLDEFEDFVSLRVEGRKRIWGIKLNNIFYILWWDPKHEVCLSKKKHT